MSLRRIEMKFNFLLLSNLHLILRLFPHLTHLTFGTLTDDIDFISPLVWHEFLSTYLLELKQLQFHIQIRGKTQMFDKDLSYKLFQNIDIYFQ